MITVAINNNDILYKSLSNTLLQNRHGLEIELKKVTNDKLNEVICSNKSKDGLIILDAGTSITFWTNVLNNAIKKLEAKNTNIIILVVDSNSISNTKTEEKHHIFKNNHTYNKLLEIINVISETLKDTFEIEKQVDDILWRLGFTAYFKGTMYIKDAILLTYNNPELLLDMNNIVEKIAEKNNIRNSNSVRVNMDRALGNMFDYIDKKIIYEIFEDYDGRIISLRYFIDLCIRYLEKQKYYCLEH